jgi:ATP-dependent Clp endopeptidase proteolytic subunit ClpP
MKSWYAIKNRSAEVIDISIHDEIGFFGVEAAEFIAQLKRHPDAKVINLSIHSPGGSVLDGLAIYNSLRGHGARIYGHVEGLAASAASYVLMAADHISMPEDAFIMIHNAHGGAMGDADELREMADIIDKLQNSMVNIYERRTGLDRDEITAMMKSETWMTAEEALALGFADTITDAIGVAAKIGRFAQHFRKLPVDGAIDPDGLATIATCRKSRRLWKSSQN